MDRIPRRDLRRASRGARHRYRDARATRRRPAATTDAIDGDRASSGLGDAARVDAGDAVDRHENREDLATGTAAHDAARPTRFMARPVIAGIAAAKQKQRCIRRRPTARPPASHRGWRRSRPRFTRRWRCFRTRLRPRPIASSTTRRGTPRSPERHQIGRGWFPCRYRRFSIRCSGGRRRGESRL
jgi:hypothetical protein